MVRSMPLMSLVLAVISALTLAGCGGGGKPRLPMAKAQGTVTYKGDPVTNAFVTFAMEGAPRVATGVTDDNGSFILTTYDSEDGAFIGTHKVTVKKKAVTSFGKPAEQMTPDDLGKLSESGKLKEMMSGLKGAIPEKYGDMSTTTLQFTIEEGENDKTITLKD